jgi:hypothetical protein
MTEITNDMICMKRGSLFQVRAWQHLLRTAGIKSRVIGDNRTAGLGTALPGSVELWIHSADMGVADVEITGADSSLRA